MMEKTLEMSKQNINKSPPMQLENQRNETFAKRENKWGKNTIKMLMIVKAKPNTVCRSNKWKQIPEANIGNITRMKSFSQPGFLGVKSSW